MHGNRAIWLIYRTDRNARGFWLVKRTLRRKKFMPEKFLELNRYFALTSYCNTIVQSNNASSILGFSLAENLRVQVLTFQPLTDITNNEHLPSPFLHIKKVLSFQRIVVDTLKIRSQDPPQESARGHQWLTDRLIQVTHCNCCTKLSKWQFNRGEDNEK